MQEKTDGILSFFRTAWRDIMPMTDGVSFASQDYLKNRVTDLELDIRQPRELPAQSHLKVPAPIGPPCLRTEWVSEPLQGRAISRCA